MAPFNFVGDSLIGTDAADTLNVAAGNTTISAYRYIGGRSGDDVINIAQPLDAVEIVGGDGGDRVELASASATTVRGGNDNDLLVVTGTFSNALANLNAGDDAITVANANGGAIYGGGGNDTITAGNITNSELRGGSGNDRVVVLGTSTGANTVNGNDGDDRIDGSSAANALLLRGGSGSDVILASGYNDTLVAGSGADSVVAGAGDDAIVLNLNDTSALSDKTINGGIGADVLEIGYTSGARLVTDSAFSHVSLTEAVLINDADSLGLRIELGSASVSAGVNSVFGGAGADTIAVLAGRSTAAYLAGGIGNDSINGGAGADTLLGGSGIDIQRGGGGNDLFLLGSTIDAGEQIDGDGGSNSVQFDGVDGANFSVASLRNIQELILAEGGAGDTYTIRQGISGAANAITVSGLGILARELDKFVILKFGTTAFNNSAEPDAASVLGVGDYYLEKTGTEDILYYWDEDLNNRVAVTFDRSANGSVSIVDGNLVYTSAAPSSPAVISGNLNGSVIEAGGVNNGTAGTPSATADLNCTDPDNPADTWTEVPAGTASLGGLGTYSLSASGVWTYVLDNNDSVVQALKGDESTSDTFRVLTIDGTSSVVTVIINGANDAPSAPSTSTATAIEDQILSPGNLITATDPDSDPLTYTPNSTSGTYGDFSINGSGAWSYNLNNAAANVQSLASGSSVTDTFSVVVSDSQGGSATTNVVVTIEGTNDSPVIGASSTTTGNVTEDGTTSATGLIVATDVDTGTSFTYTPSSASGTYGNFSINSSGAWTYNLSNAAANVQALGTSSSATDTFSVVVSDGQGGSATTNVVVTIQGANDLPVIGASSTATGTVTEDGTTLASGLIVATDVDTGTSFTYTPSSASGTYGNFLIDSSGAWTYNLSNAAANVQALGTSSSATDTFSVVVSDGQGGSATTSVVVIVQGSNDAPSITAGPTFSATGAALTVTDDSPVLTLGITGSTLTFAPTFTSGTSNTVTFQAQAATQIGTLLINDGEGASTTTDYTLGLGTTAADSFTLLAQGATYGFEGNDTITGSAQVDFINGGSGADRITGNSAADVFVLAIGNSVARSASTFASASMIANGDSLTFGNGVDVITDFSAASDKIDIVIGAGTTTTSLIGQSSTNLTNATTSTARGTFTGGVFTLAASGADTILIQNDSTGGSTTVNDSLVTNTSIVILLGLSLDTISGSALI